MNADKRRFIFYFGKCTIPYDCRRRNGVWFQALVQNLAASRLHTVLLSGNSTIALRVRSQGPWRLCSQGLLLSFDIKMSGVGSL